MGKTSEDPPVENAVESGVKKIKKRKPNEEKGYTIYIHKVLKKATDGKTISARAVEVVNMLIGDLETRLTDKAFELAKFQKKSTLSAKHVQTATKLVFPPEMSGTAIVGAGDAINRFTS